MPFKAAILFFKHLKTMKGALGLVVAALVIWVFWMSWEWLRNRNKNKKEE